MRLNSIVMSVAVCGAALVGGREAHALSVPDSGTCSGSGTCLAITAPTASLSDVALQGTGSTGVAGYSSVGSAEGVFGE